jgi:hypothetical protein
MYFSPNFIRAIERRMTKVVKNAASATHVEIHTGFYVESLKGRPKGKGKIIPVTGGGGSKICETSRIPHFLDNRLTDGDEVVSLTRRPSFTPRKIPDTIFC